MVLELGDCGEEAVDGGVASAAAADMAVTTADTPAATAAAVAAEDGEAAVDVARLGRARALLVAGAKFSGTIDIPGIHDGVDEESLYEARCATHHIPPPHTHTSTLCQKLHCHARLAGAQLHAVPLLLFSTRAPIILCTTSFKKNKKTHQLPLPLFLAPTPTLLFVRGPRILSFGFQARRRQQGVGLHRARSTFVYSTSEFFISHPSYFLRERETKSFPQEL